MSGENGIIKLRQKQAKSFIDAKLWEPMQWHSGHFQLFYPETLQELIDDLIRHLHTVKPTTNEEDSK